MRRAVWLLTLCVMALTGGGCSDDDSSPGSTATGGATTSGTSTTSGGGGAAGTGTGTATGTGGSGGSGQGGGVPAEGCPDTLPTGMKICADFEEPDNADEQVWSHYLERGFVEGLAGSGQRWMLDADAPQSGSFCVRSMDPNEDLPGGEGNDADSVFRFAFAQHWGANLSYSDEVFIRYHARFPTDWQPEATDSNGGANHLRLDGEDNRDIEVTFLGGWLHWYDYDVFWTDTVFLADAQWHEYAIWIQMPSSDSASDGVFRVWRDAGGVYQAANALWNYAAASQSREFLRVAVGSPCYYKGPVSGNWTYWIDNYQAWDRVP